MAKRKSKPDYRYVVVRLRGLTPLIVANPAALLAVGLGCWRPGKARCSFFNRS